MIEKEWVVGQKVILYSGRNEMYLRTVAKVGKIHFLLEGSDTKYRVNEGRATRQSGWHSDFVCEATFDRLEELRTRQKDKKVQEALRELIDKATRLLRSPKRVEYRGRIDSAIAALGVIGDDV